MTTIVLLHPVPSVIVFLLVSVCISSTFGLGCDVCSYVKYKTDGTSEVERLKVTFQSEHERIIPNNTCVLPVPAVCSNTTDKECFMEEEKGRLEKGDKWLEWTVQIQSCTTEEDKKCFTSFIDFGMSSDLPDRYPDLTIMMSVNGCQCNRSGCVSITYQYASRPDQSENTIRTNVSCQSCSDKEFKTDGSDEMNELAKNLRVTDDENDPAPAVTSCDLADTCSPTPGGACSVARYWERRERDGKWLEWTNWYYACAKPEKIFWKWDDVCIAGNGNAATSDADSLLNGTTGAMDHLRCHCAKHDCSIYFMGNDVTTPSGSSRESEEDGSEENAGNVNAAPVILGALSVGLLFCFTVV